MDDIDKMLEQSEKIAARAKISYVWLLKYLDPVGGTIWSMLFWEFEDAQRIAQLDVGPIKWSPSSFDEDAYIGRLSITDDYRFHLTKMKIY